MMIHGLVAQEEPNAVPKGYRNLEEINLLMKTSAQQYPDLASLINLSERYGMKTFEGRSIFGLKITNEHSDKDSLHKPHILIAAAHHAREVTTPEAALYVAHMVLVSFKRIHWITELLNNFHIWVVPVVNVDGYSYVFAKDNMWRKNRFINNGNHSEIGVDLNRNYDLGWEKCSGSSNPVSYIEDYKGKSVQSEAEVQTITALSSSHHFVKVLDFHSYGRQVLLGYKCTQMPKYAQDYISRRGKYMAKLGNYGTRKPTADGEHQEWHIKHTTNYAYLIEICEQFQPEYSTVQIEIKDYIWPMVSHFLKTPLPVHGYVFESVTRRPLSAEIKVLNVEEWKSGETRHSHISNGAYTLFLPARTEPYKIQFSSPYHTPITIEITISDDSEFAPTIFKDVFLKRFK
jgi:hypothetical protein